MNDKCQHNRLRSMLNDVGFGMKIHCMECGESRELNARIGQPLVHAGNIHEAWKVAAPIVPRICGTCAHIDTSNLVEPCRSCSDKPDNPNWTSAPAVPEKPCTHIELMAQARAELERIERPFFIIREALDRATRVPMQTELEGKLLLGIRDAINALEGGQCCTCGTGDRTLTALGILRQARGGRQ